MIKVSRFARHASGAIASAQPYPRYPLFPQAVENFGSATVEFLEIEPAREKPFTALEVLLDACLVVLAAFLLGDAPGFGLVGVLDLCLAPDEFVPAGLQSQAKFSVALAPRGRSSRCRYWIFFVGGSLRADKGLTWFSGRHLGIAASLVRDRRPAPCLLAGHDARQRNLGSSFTLKPALGPRASDAGNQIQATAENNQHNGQATHTLPSTPRNCLNTSLRL